MCAVIFYSLLDYSQMTLGSVFSKQSDTAIAPRHGDGSGSITAMAPARKKELDKICAKWVAKSCRPLSMPENDAGLREWVSAISGGKYKPPSAVTLQNYLLDICKETMLSIKVCIMYMRPA